MSLAIKGVTVAFREVAKFDQLTDDEAKHLIYDELIPVCERAGVKLSDYGNHLGIESLLSVEDYEVRKGEQQLFNVKRIKKAFQDLIVLLEDQTEPKDLSFSAVVIEKTDYFETSSQKLKTTLVSYFNPEIKKGDLVVAMLLKGFRAQFGSRGESLQIDCDFNCRIRG